MKKILDFIFSTKLMAIAFLIFAAAMGIATFIENDFGTQTAKKLVYNTWWFELILIIFIINFLGNIKKYKLYKKEKWSVLLFHLAFLLIILGAGITRYIGSEGLMILDEGEESNIILSDKNYLNIIIDDHAYQKEYNEELLLSAWGKNELTFSKIFKPTKEAKPKTINFKLVDYIPWVEKKFVEDSSKPKHLMLVESASGRHNHYIKEGTVQNLHNILVGFNSPKKVNINIKSTTEGLQILSGTEGKFRIMATKEQGVVKKDSLQKFNLRSLYQISGLPFVVPKPPIRGVETTVRGKKSDEKSDALVFDIDVDGKTERQTFIGKKFNTNSINKFNINGLYFKAWYGAKRVEIPFKVKLRDFQLEKYPGSESASSFASEVTVIDGQKTFDYRIFMNHILNYKGYKFFQSSYANEGQEIEQTHLSVNHDFWGTFVSYAGYFLLFACLILSIFMKGTRFDKLKKSLKKINAQKASLLILFCSLGAYSQHNQHRIKIPEQKIDSLLRANIVDKKHASEFSKLVIQDAGGRMKPVHTFASELVRKVAHTDNYKGYTPSQIFLSMVEFQDFWYQVPFVYLGKKHNKEIRKVLGVDENAKFARFSDFITDDGIYKIGKAVDKAQKSRIKNKFEQDLLKVDKRVWLLSSALSGKILRIFPIPNNPKNRWVSPMEAQHGGMFKGRDSIAIPRLIPLYKQTLYFSKQKKDYAKSDEILNGIKTLQRKYGHAVIPSDKKINTEILYNKLKIFTVASYWYPTWGLMMIVFIVLGIFFNSKIIKYLIKGLIFLVACTFVYHTFGLGLRWYLSGNAPWSNAYESIIYVAWATMLFGLWFGRKSSLTIGATSFLTGMILVFANQHWLDPEIANLQPVLNSWWLMVHVSIIVASYGPFALCMLLGILGLVLTIFSTQKNKKEMNLKIKELTIINEMSMNVGLAMLTIGNFLGGMWANESWGRYWGWDPKETWALISIMIYAFVLHMRLVPGLKGRITFNFASAFAFLSVMMTYFGVNFYLTGLHSYASGDQAVTPKEAYIFAWLIIAFAIIAKDKHHKI